MRKSFDQLEALSFNEVIALAPNSETRTPAPAKRLPETITHVIREELANQLREHYDRYLELRGELDRCDSTNVKRVFKAAREAFRVDPLNVEPPDRAKIQKDFWERRHAVSALFARESLPDFAKVYLESLDLVLEELRETVRVRAIYELGAADDSSTQDFGLDSEKYNPLRFETRCLLLTIGQIEGEKNRVLKAVQAVEDFSRGACKPPVFHVSRSMLELLNIIDREPAEEIAESEPEPVFASLSPRPAKVAKARPSELIPMQ